MVRRLLLWLLLVGLVVSCTTTASSGPPTTSVTDTCVDPPASELAQVTSVVLTVDPNPVTPGSKATLSIDSRLPAGLVDGVAAWWQCWNGIAWIDTHLVERGWSGEPITLKIDPEVTTTIPAIGLPVPNSFQIAIPDVAPGIYRIRDELGMPAGDQTQPGTASVAGFVIVEVESDSFSGSRRAVPTPSGRTLDCPSELIASGTFDLMADAVGSDTPQAALDRFVQFERFAGEAAVEEKSTDEVVFVFTDGDGNRLGRVFVGRTDNGWFALRDEQCGER
jgi:hypothetical protein